MALEEGREEAGLAGLLVTLPACDLEVHAVGHGDQLGEPLHLDLRFVVLAPPGAALLGNHESLDLRWVTLAELEEIADEDGIIRLARAGMAAAREAGLSGVS